MSMQAYNSASVSTFSSGIYRHVALTISGSTHTLYLDGSAVAVNTNAGNIFASYPSTINNLYIGCAADLTYGYTGIIDDFKIFNRALPPSDIKSITNNNVSSFTDLTTMGGLVFWLDATVSSSIVGTSNSTTQYWYDKKDSSKYFSVLNSNYPSYVNLTTFQNKPAVYIPYLYNKMWYKSDTLNNNQFTVFHVFSSAPSPTTDYNILFGPKTANGFFLYQLPNDSNLKYGLYGGAESTIAANSTAAIAMTTCQVDYTNNTVNVNYNGTNKANTTLSGTVPTNYYLQGGGVNTAGVTSNSNLYMYEIAFFNGILSSYEYQRVEGYLASKWGITLPTTHPYYSVAPLPITSSTLFDMNNYSRDPTFLLWIDANNANHFSYNTSNVITSIQNISYNNTPLSIGGVNTSNIIYQTSNSFTTTPCIRLGSYSDYTFIDTKIPNINYQTELTFFFVVAYDSSFATSTAFQLYGASPNNRSDFSNTLNIARSNNTTVKITASEWGVTNNGNSSNLVTDTNFSPNTFHLISWTTSKINNTQYLGIDGTYSSTNQNGTTAVPFPGSGADGLNNVISSAIYTNSIFSIAYIKEAIGFTRSLSTSEFKKIEGYLAWKWGINTYLPTSHRYYSIAPQIVSVSGVLNNVSVAGKAAMLNTGTSLQSGAYGLVILNILYRGATIQLTAGISGTPTDFYAQSTINYGTLQTLDGISLITFLAGQTAYVTKWYDQTGNGSHAMRIGNPTYNTTTNTIDFTTGYFYLPDNAVPTGNSPYSILFTPNNQTTDNNAIFHFGPLENFQSCLATLGYNNPELTTDIYDNSWYTNVARYGIGSSVPPNGVKIADCYDGTNGLTGRSVYINNVSQSYGGPNMFNSSRNQGAGPNYIGHSNYGGENVKNYSGTLQYFFWAPALLSLSDITILNSV